MVNECGCVFQFGLDMLFFWLLFMCVLSHVTCQSKVGVGVVVCCSYAVRKLPASLSKRNGTKNPRDFDRL